MAAAPNAASSQELVPEHQLPDKQQNENQGSSGKRQKSRHRASVACASCRDRRIRCVVPLGESECTQCKRSGIECIIKNDDERRRPISRAYMCSLTERVALLEGMLKERNVEPPPTSHPPMTRHGLPRIDDPSPPRKKSLSSTFPSPTTTSTRSNTAPLSNPEHSSPSSQPDGSFDGDHLERLETASDDHGGDSVHSASSPSVLPPPKKDGMVSRLLSTRGHLSFDQLSGRLRYFGPTTNCHVHSELGVALGPSQDSLEQARRAEKTIRFLSMETHDYLMDLFWQNYNAVLHVLHQEAFQEDRDSGRTQFYSGFLHVCVLAMGYRFADRTRPDMQRISLPGRESTLHREAKYMLDFELERPGGIPSVVALLLLGDLECGVGRDNLGWLYAGMAVRIAFDIGLHLDTRDSGLPEREVEIRRMTLWACVIYDKYWALFLGRPTSMKSADLEVYHLAKQFERLGTCKPAGLEKALETQIYEALLDLMELAGKITENLDPRAQTDAYIDRDAYLRMAALDREFGNWYARLPEPLRWTPQNIQTAPFSFFLLHQQYHAALILLHRPFAMYEEPAASDSEDSTAGGPDNHFSALSRTVCTKHAIRVARIFWQHRQRFDTRQIFVTGLQHAGTAATALVAALAFIKEASDRSNNMQYLECLSAALQDMAYTYQPAERMFIVLQAVLAELRGTPGDFSNNFRGKGIIPARRGSTMIDEMDPPSFSNKRQRAFARTHSSKSGFRRQNTSMSIDVNIDPALAGMPGLTRKVSGSEHNGQDGWTMVTPRSEVGPTSWSTLSTSELHNGSVCLDPGSLGGPTPTSLPSQKFSLNGSTWMGAPDNSLETHDIANIAMAHFPELREIPSVDSDGGGPVAGHLDFMTLGGGEEWRDWQPRSIGDDLNDFPSTRQSFAAQLSSAAGFGAES